MKNALRPFAPLELIPVPVRLRICGAVIATALGLGLWSSAAQSLTITSKGQQPQFRYAGGTEDIPADCPGTLQLTNDSITYTCAQKPIAVPYRAIETMEYRDDVIRRVRKLKVKWQVVPPIGRARDNRYFTLVYRLSGVTHVMILDVTSDEMRPYLAEIDLKAGRRVDVQRHEDYE
jgi:hypothetical protein